MAKQKLYKVSSIPKSFIESMLKDVKVERRKMKKLYDDKYWDGVVSAFESLLKVGES